MLTLFGNVEPDPGAAQKPLTGPYDIIARAEARSLKELGDKVLGPIHGLVGVVRTLTCPVVHG